MSLLSTQFQNTPKKGTTSVLPQYPGSNEELGSPINKTPRRKSTLGLLRSVGSIDSSVNKQQFNQDSQLIQTDKKLMASPPIRSKEYRETDWSEMAK
jgi:hypothetical protein